MDEAGRFVLFSQQRQLDRIERTETVRITKREGETVFIPRKEKATLTVKGDAVNIQDGVRSALNAEGCKVVFRPKIPAAVKRIASEVLTDQNNAQKTAVGAVWNHVLRSDKGKVNLEFARTPVQTDRLHGVFGRLRNAVVVAVVEALKPSPHLELTRQPFLVADFQS